MEHIIISTETNPDLAASIASLTGISICPVVTKTFSNQEIALALDESVTGKTAFLVASTFPPAENILKLLMLANTLKESGVEQVIALIPYFGYGRSDYLFSYGFPVDAKLMTALMKCAGIDHVIMIDLHSSRIEPFFTIPTTHLSALPILANHLRDMKLGNLSIVSPDKGGVDRACKFAKELTREFAKEFDRGDIITVTKHRKADEDVEIKEIIGDVSGKNIVIVDDMIQSGSTVIKVAEALKKQGAGTIYVVATHLIHTARGAQHIAAHPDIMHTIVTNTIPLSENVAENSAIQEKFTIVSIDTLFAETTKAFIGERNVPTA